MFNRSFMPSGLEEKAKKTLLWIIGINVGIFVLQLTLNATGARGFLENVFGLSLNGLLTGFVWTPFTYAFLHDTGNFFHLMLNMALIYMVGTQIFPLLGQKRFLQLYGLTAITGGVLFLLVSLLSGGGRVVGASGVWYGFLAFFVMLAPEEEILFMFFLRMKRKVLGFIMLGIGVLGLIFYEILGTGGMTAHSAHLGGMLGGYLFYKYVFAANPYDNKGGLNISLPKIFSKKSSQPQAKSYRYNVNVSKPKDMKREVDRILDKINSKGFGSLTAEEKRVLDDAKDLLRKR